MEHLHEGHRERLKDRFLKNGLNTFEPHNVLELLLFYAIPRRDTNEIAHRLIQEFGSLANVFDAPYERLIQVPGIGYNAAILIKMIPEISRAYLENKNKLGIMLDTTEKIGHYLIPRFIGVKNEEVHIICLDNKLKVICCVKVIEGTINAAQVSIRRIIEELLKFNASAVVVSHNHPNGIALPSQGDIDVTRKLKAALDFVGITLIDHIIVAGDDFVSLADSGQFLSMTK